MNKKWVELVRFFVFPALLGGMYLAQKQIPGLLEFGALWSDAPRWWQFFTNGFFSGNTLHLVVNMCSLLVVCSQFVPQVRLPFLLIYFTLFSAASSFLYFLFLMPAHAWLVGASSGIYSLVGFVSWFYRRDRVCLLGIRRLSSPILPAILILLLCEFLIAVFWIPTLAWQLHVIAFLLSLTAAMAAHAGYVLCRWLAGRHEPFGRGILVMHKLKAAAVCEAAEKVE